VGDYELRSTGPTLPMTGAKHLQYFMQVFHTAKRQISTKRWLRFVELLPYCRVPVWATGLKSQWKTCFFPLAQNIMRLWKASGRTFLVAYLKECCKILVLWVSGESYAPLARGVRVSRARSGPSPNTTGPPPVAYRDEPSQWVHRWLGCVAGDFNHTLCLQSDWLQT